MQARDVMSSPVVSTTLHATLDVATQAMQDHGIGHLVVTDDNRLVLGVLRRKDLQRALASSITDEPGWRSEATWGGLLERARAVPVIEAMQRLPSLVRPEDDLAQVAAQLKDSPSDCVIVAENRRALGIITAADLVRAMASGQ